LSIRHDGADTPVGPVRTCPGRPDGTRGRRHRASTRGSGS
jgi:hypothetical protein